MSDIKDSTKQVMTDIGDGIEKLASDIKQAFKGRNHTLMVRVDDDTLNRIDELVETEIFTSRSEAAAFLLYQGIEKQDSLFKKLRESSSKIKSLRESMKEIVANELINKENKETDGKK